MTKKRTKQVVKKQLTKFILEFLKSAKMIQAFCKFYGKTSLLGYWVFDKTWW